MSYAEKDDIINEVEGIRELLTETQERLAMLPRTQTATRQLSVIVNRLEGWERTFGPTRLIKLHSPMPKGCPFSQAQIDRALKAYRKYGYRGMTREQKEAFRWWDEHYPES